MHPTLKVRLGEHVLEIPVCYDAAQCARVCERWPEGIVDAIEMFASNEGEPLEAKRALYRMAARAARTQGLEIPERPARATAPRTSFAAKQEVIAR